MPDDFGFSSFSAVLALALALIVAVYSYAALTAQPRPSGIIYPIHADP